jgi:hypothetical protein
MARSTSARRTNAQRSQSSPAQRLSSDTLVINGSQATQQQTQPQSQQAPTPAQGPALPASDKIRALTGVNPDLDSFRIPDLFVKHCERLIAFVRSAQDDLKEYLIKMTEVFDVWSLRPNENNVLVPVHANTPYRRYICPEPSCFKLYTQRSSVAQHCRDTHHRNVVYTTTEDEDFFHRLPNWNGRACALVCAVSLLASADADTDTSTLPQEQVTISNTTFTRYTCPLDEAIWTPSLGAAWRLATALHDMTEGRWSMDDPQSIVDTIRYLCELNPRMKAQLEFSRIVSCSADQSRCPTKTFKKTVLGFSLKSLNSLGGIPVGGPAATGNGILCSTCHSMPEMHLFVFDKRCILLQTPHGLTEVPTNEFFVGEASHNLRFRVDTLVTTGKTSTGGAHSVVYSRYNASSCGWYLFDGANPPQEALPNPALVRYVLISMNVDNVADNEDDTADVTQAQYFGNDYDDQTVGEDLGGSPTLSIATLNTHSLTKRLSEVADLCASSHVVCLTETWQPDKHAMAFLRPRPHVLQQRESRAGGTAIVLSHGSSITARTTGVHANVEYSACTATVPGTPHPLHIMAVYAPPNADCDVIAAAHRAATALHIDQFDIIAGDFNARHASWDPGPSSNGSSWARGRKIDSMWRAHYSAHSAPTHGQSCIDVIFTRRGLTRSDPKLVALGTTSDHKALKVTFNAPRTHRASHRTLPVRWDSITPAQEASFIEVLSRSCHGQPFRNRDKEHHKLASALVQACATLPGGQLRRPSFRPPDSVLLPSKQISRRPWRALHRLRKPQSETCSIDPDRLATAFAEPHNVNPPLSPGEVDSWQNLTATDVTPLTIHDIRHALCSARATASPDTDHVHPRMLQLASRCSAFVCRLTSLANGTFSGHWPKAWKQANVRPLRKPAKAADSVAGWRPISILSWFLRVVERPIRARLMAHVQLHPAAIGFRKGLATDFLTAAIARINQLNPNALFWAVIAFDFSQAFPSVLHELILRLLREAGVPRYLIRWIFHYLHGRCMRVMHHVAHSLWVALTCGYPQGGLLGPLLWLIVSSALLDTLERVLRTRRPHMLLAVAAAYADDTSTAVAATTKDMVISTCAALVAALSEWSRAHGITISDKTRLAANFNWPPTRELICAGRDIAAAAHDAQSPDNACKVIGLTIQGKLRGGIDFDTHVSDAIDAYWSDVSLLMAIRNWTSIAVIRQMYSAICLPHLARHLPAIATRPEALARLSRTHAQGIKTVFGLLQNTRNDTAVFELGFPTIDELAATRSTTIAVQMEYFPDLAIAPAATATAQSLAPLPRLQLAPNERHLPPLTDGGRHLAATPPLIVVCPTQVNATDDDKIAFNQRSLASIPPQSYVVMSDGSKCPPVDPLATGAGSAALLLGPAADGTRHVLAQWHANVDPHASTLTCEGFAITIGATHLLEPVPTEALITYVTDSLSFVASLDRGPTLAHSLLEASFWSTLIARHAASPRAAPISIRFAYSHVSTEANSPAIRPLVSALSLIDTMAKQAAQHPHPTLLSRAEDRLRQLRTAARSQHRTAIASKSLRGATDVHHGSVWKERPPVSGTDLRMLLQARCGICSFTGGHLHGASPPCPRCHAIITPGHDHMVRHVFECPVLSAARLQLGATSLASLWLKPKEAVKLLHRFIAHVPDPVALLPDTDSADE